MKYPILHICQSACRWVCVLGLVCGVMCGLSSCQWHEADAVVAMADSIDQNHHVIYDDTVALRKAIHTLNTPLGQNLQTQYAGQSVLLHGSQLGG